MPHGFRQLPQFHQSNVRRIGTQLPRFGRPIPPDSREHNRSTISVCKLAAARPRAIQKASSATAPLGDFAFLSHVARRGAISRHTVCSPRFASHLGRSSPRDAGCRAGLSPFRKGDKRMSCISKTYGLALTAAWPSPSSPPATLLPRSKATSSGTRSSSTQSDQQQSDQPSSDEQTRQTESAATARASTPRARTPTPTAVAAARPTIAGPRPVFMARLRLIARPRLAAAGRPRVRQRFPPLPGRAIVQPRRPAQPQPARRPRRQPPQRRPRRRHRLAGPLRQPGRGNGHPAGRPHHAGERT